MQFSGAAVPLSWFLNRLTWCFCGEPEHTLILVVVSSCLWFLREELRGAGVSINLSLMQLTSLASTFCSTQRPSYLERFLLPHRRIVHFRLRRYERHNSHKPDRNFPRTTTVHADHAVPLEEQLTMS